MPQLTSRARRIVALVSAVVPVAVTGAIHVWMVDVRLERLAAVHEETRVLHTRIRNDRSAQRAERLRADDRALDRAVPWREEVAPLLSALARDLDDLDVRDRAVSTEPPRSMGPFRYIQLNVSFRGSFEALFRLLQRINQQERIVRLDRLLVSREHDAGAEDLMTSIRFNAYIQDDQPGRD